MLMLWLQSFIIRPKSAMKCLILPNVALIADVMAHSDFFEFVLNLSCTSSTVSCIRVLLFRVFLHQFLIGVAVLRAVTGKD